MPHVFRNDKLCTSDGLDGDTSCVWWVAPSWRQVALTYPVEFSGGGPWKSWLLRVHWLIGQFGRFIQLKCNYEYIYIILHVFALFIGIFDVCHVWLEYVWYGCKRVLAMLQLIRMFATTYIDVCLFWCDYSCLIRSHMIVCE
jgi:hypothetical protein